MSLFYEEEVLIAVIGDIKDSRNLRSRDLIQNKITQILNEINNKYSNDITSKFLITLGDEFQGLLSCGENLINIINEIKMRLYPVEIRFGIGIGKITTQINSEMALGSDGPAYYNARKSLEILKKNEKKNKKVTSDIYLVYENQSEVLLINTIFELMKVIEQNWTEKQKSVIWDMIKNKDTQKIIAIQNGISQSSANKMLKKGSYYVYDNAIKNVNKALSEFKRW